MKARQLVAYLVLTALSLSAIRVSAQTTTAYPTLDALQAATIPAADPIDLARRLRGITTIDPPPTIPALYQIGDHARFFANNLSTVQTFEVDASLRAIGDHIYLWVQDGIIIAESDLQALAAAFDQTIYDAVRDLWGGEATPGIDGDPRVYGLFARNLGNGTNAYYAGRHAYPSEVIPFSNEHEMFFFNLDMLGLDVDNTQTESTLAHEFQHMIRANLDLNEDIWLDEGFSTFTELYQNYGTTGWYTGSFVAAPETQLNAWGSPSGAHYGAALLFVTYFYERYGLDALHTLSADPETGLDTIGRAIPGNSESTDEFFADWVLANFLRDTSLNDGQYGYALLPELPQPAVRATINAYPYLASGIANQYGTHYYVFTDLDSYSSIDLTITAPSVVSLVPVSAASGQHVWYSNRGDSMDSRLTRTFDLSDVNSATLTYRAWYQIEAGWDYAYVMVSTDEGATWDILPATNTTTVNPNGNAYGPGYTGDSGGWIVASASLDAYAGQDDVLIRFEAITDDALNLPGTVIDDVTIPEIGYASDFEADDGGWQAEGWLWMDNVLPQQAWVQIVQFAGDTVEITRQLLSPQAGTGDWQIPLVEGVDQVMVALSPFAPTTTVPMPYTLSVVATP